jgi:hypothetical protein
MLYEGARTWVCVAAAMADSYAACGLDGKVKSCGMASKVVQNKGAKAHKMANPRKGGTTGIVPGTGSPAVKFEGTIVTAAPREGITTPSKGNAGSHDHKARTHADG